MLTILINAYACGPNRGSEPGMAWNWCCHLAKHCELHIITEGEFRDDIERVLPTMEFGKNMHFYYLPVDEKIRHMCWNQGDWRFYYYYAQWQNRALAEARRILESTNVDVIHQLNMIGFREPGRLWKIEDIPYIWGPTNAKEAFPTAYLYGAPIKKKCFIFVKNTITKLQLAWSKIVHSAAKRADCVIAASSDSALAIKKYLPAKIIVNINESGCELPQATIPRFHQTEVFNILWVGRFIFTKQITIALQAIAKSSLEHVHLHIVGGTEEEEAPFKQYAQELGIVSQCIWHKKIPHSEVQKLMQESDLFFFTSVAEGTPHVVLESIANGLPVLCFDTCGHGDCVDSTVGIKIPLTNPKQSVKEFAEKIDYLYHHREELQRMSEGCRTKQQELSWEKKAEQMVEIYQKAIAQHEGK